MDPRKDSVSQLTLLNDKNYGTWSVKMECILIRDSVWNIVEAPKPEGAALTDAWVKGNDKARCRILLGIEDNQIIHVKHLKTAHDVWFTLKKMYERTSLGSRLFLRRKLYTSRYASGHLRDHINTMLEVVCQLRTAGVLIDQSETVAALLASLPDSYGTLVTTLEGRDEEVLTVEYVTGKMLDEYQRRTEGGAVGDDSVLALQTSARHPSNRGKQNLIGKKSECFYCHKTGHFKSECRKRLWDLKQTGKGGAASKATSNSKKPENGNSTSDASTRYTAFAACERTYIAKANNRWLVDSGCTSHMTNDRSFFHELKKTEGEVLLATKDLTLAEGIGSGKVRCYLPDGNIEDITLNDVLYVPELGGGLLSVSKMAKNGYKVVFEDDGCRVERNSDASIVATARMEGNLYFFNDVRPEESAHSTVDTNASLEKWHRRFGHRDQAAIKKLVTDKLVKGLLMNGNEEHIQACECCIKGKMSQLPFTVSKSRTTRPLELIHSDVCGPMQLATPSGNRYCLTMIDDYSRFTVVRLLKHKSEVPSAIKEIITSWTTEIGYKPKALRTDNGKEYVNTQLINYLKQKGIKHQTTVVYTPQQNGVAERKNRSLQEMAKCMLLDSNLPTRFWGEAMITSAYLQNRLPSRSISKTPRELWDGIKPDVSHIRIFGSKCFTFVPKQLRKKWDDKAEEGVLIGYSDTTKGYKILDVNSNQVRICRTVKIIEPEVPINADHSPVPEGEVFDRKVNLSEPSQVAGSPKESSTSPQATAPLSDPQLRTSLRTTKGQPPKRFSPNAECHYVQEPANMNEVLKLPPREQRLWMQAAAEEIKSMEELKVWELVNLPPGRKAITVKWVFKTKVNPEGQVDTYKARLVARGFSQRYGQDYDETFAPVVKHDTVRTLLAVAAAHKLHVRHLDVKSAYLNGILEEEIYVEQPPGFEVQGQEDKVFLLHKSLYGLKQSARTWNKMATETLSELLFEQGKGDQCLFTRVEKDGTRTYVLIYVDDLLVVGATEEITKKVGKQLDKFFHTKDLGDVKNYLGIQLEKEGDGSFLLHQQNKIDLMLTQHGLQECKPVSTPMETSFLATNEGSPIMPNNTRYRQAIGSLLYIATVSRPDIAVSVGILCRRVEKPTEADWKSVKRVMRYLATTKNRKLRLSSAGDVKLRCYVDADWAGNREDRKSTSGFVFQLGNSVVAWSSRKQSSVALSSTEAEYVAASHACRELLFLRQLLRDLGIPASGPTLVLEDNQACIKMVDSERSGARTKHIDVCHHHVRDLRKQGIVELQYCPSNEMLADIFTKPLCKDSFQRFTMSLGLED